jgi:hypothetical protein
MGKALSNMDAKAHGILGDFEGTAVTQTGIEIRNAGGGLHESMLTDPMLKKKGDHYYVLMRCDVVDLHFPNVKGNEDQSRRVHISRAVEGSIIDPEIAQPMIEQQIKRNEERHGIQRMFEETSGDPGPVDPKDGGKLVTPKQPRKAAGAAKTPARRGRPPKGETAEQKADRVVGPAGGRSK